VHLVGFFVGMYHDARSSECPIHDKDIVKCIEQEPPGILKSNRRRGCKFTSS